MKKYSRAFTLIELLVVIAIIAILAAILFPVFAQAKAAAKGAASISNVEQEAVAMAIYKTDFDDTFPPATSWNTGSDPLCFVRPGMCFSTWVWLLQPYTKNAGIFDDPLGPGFPTGDGFPLTIQASINSTYGYNYNALAPWYGTTRASMTTHVQTDTNASQPANLPLFTSKYATLNTSWSDKIGNLCWGFFFDLNLDNGPTLNNTVDPPNCATIPSFCIGNWGTYYSGNYSWTLFIGQASQPNDPKAVIEGIHTGGNSRRAAGNIVAAFCDTHAKKQSPGAMAVGTNWHESIDDSGVNLKVTNINSYIWTMTPGS